MKTVVARLTLACVSIIAMSLMFTAQGDAEIDPESMVAAWLFDEGTGKVAKDISGNGYDGELKENPLWVDGKFGKALEFNGTNYVEIRNSSSSEVLSFGGNQPFSITAWVKTQSGGQVISKYNSGVGGTYFLRIWDRTVTIDREVAPWKLSGTQALPLGEFAHVAVIYDGVEMKIYINGELNAKQDMTGANNTDTVTPVLIGARFNNGVPGELFTGVLDEVALFNVALSEKDIKSVIENGLSKAPVETAGKLSITWGLLKTR